MRRPRSPFPLGLPQRDDNWPATAHAHASRFRWACPSGTTTGQLPPTPTLPVSAGLAPAGRQLASYRARPRFPFPLGLPQRDDNWPATAHAHASRFRWACPSGTTTGQLPRTHTLPVSAGLAPAGRQLVSYRARPRSPVSAGLAPAGRQLASYRARPRFPVSAGLAPAGRQLASYRARPRFPFPLGLPQRDDNWPATAHAHAPRFRWACPSGTTTGQLPRTPTLPRFRWACPSGRP